MNENVVAARLFRFINGEVMDERASTGVDEFFGAQGSKRHLSEAEYKQLILQPRIPELIAAWRPVFDGPEPVENTQAQRFISQVLEAFESVDFLMDYRCTSGFVDAQKGLWNDYRVYRPGLKCGWGLHLTTAGEGVYNCLNRSLRVSSGDLVLLAPDAFYDYARAPDSDNWAVHWACFNVDERYLDLLNWPLIAAGVHHLPATTPEFGQRCSEILGEVHSLSDSEHGTAQRLRSNLMEQLLLLCSTVIPPDQRKAIDSRVTTAIESLQGDLTRNVSIDEIAAQACTSVSTLTRLFKQHTGLSMLAWRDQKRMALACEKLTHSRMRIADVAELCGYTDQLYFSRCFHKHFACSPSQYRKRYWQDKA